jgi:AcrR family transcriptional regulator
MRATGELVAKRGYSKVSVSLIIKRARVSHRTFYNHFGSKEDAFLALFDSVVAETQKRVGATLLDERDAPWAKQVILAVVEVLAVIAENPIIARACIVEAPAVGSEIVGRYRDSVTGLSPLLRLGRTLHEGEGELPETLEDTLAGSILWSAYQRLIVGESDRIEGLIPETTLFVLRPYLGEAEAARWARWSEDRTRPIPTPSG